MYTCKQTIHRLHLFLGGVCWGDTVREVSCCLRWWRWRRHVLWGNPENHGPKNKACELADEATCPFANEQTETVADFCQESWLSFPAQDTPPIQVSGVSVKIFFMEHLLVPLGICIKIKGLLFWEELSPCFWHKQLIAIAHNYKKAPKEDSLQQMARTSYWCKGCNMVVCELDYWAYHSLKGISLLDEKLSIKFINWLSCPHTHQAAIYYNKFINYIFFTDWIAITLTEMFGYLNCQILEF